MTVGRADFGISPHLRLLNHGSFGACPRAVTEAADALRREAEADPWRFMASVPGRLRAVLDAVAPLLGARGDDLAFVENATSGVSTVLRSLDLSPGDRLLTTTHVYGAVRQALRYVASRSGAVVEEAEVPFPIGGPDEVLEAVLPRLPGARLLVIDAVTSPTALVFPVGELVEAAHAVGVPVLVDAAHGPGQIPLRLDAVGADWTTGNLHKWLFAAKGTAFLHARADRRENLVPLSLSHDLPKGFPEAFDWTGTRDFAPWLSVPAALRFVEDTGGVDALMADNRRKCAEAAERIARRLGVPVPSPSSMRAAMATLGLPGSPPERESEGLFAALLERGLEPVVLPFAGRTWVRISAQVHTSPEDFDALADALVAR